MADLVVNVVDKRVVVQPFGADALEPLVAAAAGSAAVALASATSIQSKARKIDRASIEATDAFDALDSGSVETVGSRTSSGNGWYLADAANLYMTGGFQGPDNGLPDGQLCECLDIPLQVSGADEVEIKIWRRTDVAAVVAPGEDAGDELVETFTLTLAEAGLVDGAAAPVDVRVWLTTPFVSDSATFLPGYTATSLASGVSIETGFGRNAFNTPPQALRGFAKASAGTWTDVTTASTCFSYGRRTLYDVASVLDQLLSTQTIGRTVTPTTGGNSGEQTYVMADPVLAPGTLKRFKVRCATAGTVKLRRFLKSGTTLTQVPGSSDIPLALSVGDNTFTLTESVYENEFLGYYTPAGGVTLFNAATADGAGWWNAAGDQTSFTDSAANTGARLEVSFEIEYLEMPASDDSRVDLLAAEYATVTPSTLSVAVAGVQWKNGTSYPFNATLALSAAASGKERVDLIVMDRDSQAISVVAGSSRDEQLDAAEWQGAVPANASLIARALVDDTQAYVANAADFRGLVKVGREAEMARHVQRNLSMLRRTIGKADRGATIKHGGYGDSITALQDTTLKPSTLSAQYVANGAWRDRRDYYFTSYPSDTKALMALKTATSLGMADDGAGAVHIDIGWNWAIRAALMARSGAAVAYYNYGIGSTTSQDTLSGGTLPNGLYPARIAVPLADSLDSVCIAFGMNERGQTYTYANIVNMVAQFLAVGTECIVMGVPRPHKSQSITAWRYTNDALEAAAMDAGAAYVSTAMISDDRNLGGIGLPAEILCSTNILTAGYNHPGYFEHLQYGRNAVQQLGL